MDEIENSPDDYHRPVVNFSQSHSFIGRLKVKADKKKDFSQSHTSSFFHHKPRLSRSRSPVFNVTAPEVVVTECEDDDTNFSVQVRTNEDFNFEEKCLKAQQEARMWKAKYLKCSQEKLQQMSDIEGNLMVLEARLQAERRDIEEKILQQNHLLKQQKRKIDKLTTANQKLLYGLMKMSQDAEVSQQSDFVNHQLRHNASDIHGAKPLVIVTNHDQDSPNASIESNEENELEKPFKKQRSKSLSIANYVGLQL